MYTENCMFHIDNQPSKLCIIGNSIANYQPVFISGSVLSGSELFSFVLQYLPSLDQNVSLYGSIAIASKLDESQVE